MAASYVSLGVMQVLKQAHTKNLTVSDYYTSKERTEVAASNLQWLLCTLQLAS